MKKIISLTAVAVAFVNICSCQVNHSTHNMYDQEPNPAFICPITNEIFQDPVIAEDGHTYEREAITDWLKKLSKSPLTRIKMQVENIKPNIVVRSMIDAFYKFEKESKILKNSNEEFSKNFSSELNKICQREILGEECDKLIPQVNIGRWSKTMILQSPCCTQIYTCNHQINCLNMVAQFLREAACPPHQPAYSMPQ